MHQKKYQVKYSDMPTGNGNAMTLDRIYCAIGKLESHLYLTEEALRYKTQSRIDIENLLGKWKGIEYQVFYYRRVRGLTQEQTAEAIARCPRQVKRIEKKYKNVEAQCPSTFCLSIQVLLNFLPPYIATTLKYFRDLNLKQLNVSLFSHNLNYQN